MIYDIYIGYQDLFIGQGKSSKWRSSCWNAAIAHFFSEINHAFRICCVANKHYAISDLAWRPSYNLPTATIPSSVEFVMNVFKMFQLLCTILLWIPVFCWWNKMIIVLIQSKIFTYVLKRIRTFCVEDGDVINVD